QDDCNQQLPSLYVFVGERLAAREAAWIDMTQVVARPVSPKIGKFHPRPPAERGTLAQSGTGASAKRRQPHRRQPVHQTGRRHGLIHHNPPRCWSNRRFRNLVTAFGSARASNRGCKRCSRAGNITSRTSATATW